MKSIRDKEMRDIETESRVGVHKDRIAQKELLKKKAFRNLRSNKPHQVNGKIRDLSVNSTDAWDEYNNSATVDSASQQQFYNRPNKGSWQS